MADRTLDIVFTAPHPDDIEIGSGGTVAKLVKLGYRVGMVHMTNGEPTPRGTPEIRRERTVVVVQLYDLDKSGTRVTLTHLGFGEGKDWDEVHHYFAEAWPVVLGRLKDRFVKGAMDWTAVQRAGEAQAQNEAAKKGASDGR